ncbi:MAG: dTDP-4-dehydrorhamnose 3,5-epimerase [Deltaproteobacteria bacterium]|nr:MAG: dTDP-4-dehydrorhamnose 3,5-epimerase [Deltaproteobacteria bacterium]
MRLTEAFPWGILVLEPEIHIDTRGYFFEFWKLRDYRSHGIYEDFVQENVSVSYKNVLRGMHYQLQHPQGKLVTVLYGKVFDVVIDLRLNSPSFKRWFGIVLSDENNLIMYVPPGFAHGFCVMSERAVFLYKCTSYYNPEDEYGVRWNDETIGIHWPIKEPILSVKDQHLPTLQEIPEEHLFRTN